MNASDFCSDHSTATWATTSKTITVYQQQQQRQQQKQQHEQQQQEVKSTTIDKQYQRQREVVQQLHLKKLGNPGCHPTTANWSIYEGRERETWERNFCIARDCRVSTTHDYVVGTPTIKKTDDTRRQFSMRRAGDDVLSTVNSNSRDSVTMKMSLHRGHLQ